MDPDNRPDSFIVTGSVENTGNDGRVEVPVNIEIDFGVRSEPAQVEVCRKERSSRPTR